MTTYTNSLMKVNGDFSSTEKAREYAINPVWKDYDALWAFVSASQEEIGTVVYEHISNLVQNVRDIDTCGLHQLYSIAKELDVEQIFSYDLAYPVALEEIMNTLSVGRSFELTSGYILHNETLSDVYDTIGVTTSTIQYYDISGNVTTSGNYDTTGLITGNVILDDDYITGFVEPVIKNNLIEYANYDDDNVKQWTEDEITSLYQEFSAYIDRSGIEQLDANNKLSRRKLLALQYQGFMDDIYYDPASEYNSSTSGEIIDYCTHILRNICMRASYQRETLKTIAQKHAMIGSTNALEKLISEYILRSFTKKDDWRLYVEPSGTVKPQKLNDAAEMEGQLPHIYDVANPNFDVRVVEYWDNTEYMNISAESPLVCGITGYSTTYDTTSYIDISGNLITGTVSALTPDYGMGLCGYMVTGGNARFWEGENLSDNILLSETNSAEISAFYKNIGLTGDFQQMYDTQTYLWDTYAVSGLNRMANIPELTGVPLSAYSSTPVSAIPSTGWLVEPTSLSDMHRKYIGLLSGDVPPSNIKNQLYPTMAPQPFIWNLVEKVYEDFPHIYQTLLYTDQTTSQYLSSQVDISGNLIDSWLFFNQEFIGYNTKYEQATNLDFNDAFNPAIDRDGSFDVDALSAMIYYKENNIYPLSNNLSGYYKHIERNFNINTSDSPSICSQLEIYSDDIIALSGKHIYQYAYDHLDNHYMLYKSDDDFNTQGQIWMRYRNHPLPFPMSEGDQNWKETQQVDMLGGADQENISIEPVVNSKCYDFGIIGDIIWMFGEDSVGNGRIVVFALDYIRDSEGVIRYSMVPNTYATNYTPSSIIKKWFVGVYSYLDYIIFVYVERFNDGTASFKFKHYDKYDKKFIDSPIENVVISDLPDLYTVNENIWKLTTSERLVTIAYESVNTSTVSEFVNNITTIDLNKSTLSVNNGDYAVSEWKYIRENT